VKGNPYGDGVRHQITGWRWPLTFFAEFRQGPVRFQVMGFG
jgi:hypothetical protein